MGLPHVQSKVRLLPDSGLCLRRRQQNPRGHSRVPERLLHSLWVLLWGLLGRIRLLPQAVHILPWGKPELLLRRRLRVPLPRGYSNDMWLWTSWLDALSQSRLLPFGVRVVKGRNHRQTRRRG